MIKVNIKEKIINYSKEVGIDLIGFTKAETDHDLKLILKDREKKNFLSGFEEKDIDKRVDPRLILNDAKTIIVLGISYHSDKEETEEASNIEILGKISRSSWGRDYHIVLKEKMKSLSEYIENEVDDFKYNSFVDTGPLVDRHLAYMAGIGVYGKNNCIISKEYGSWIFIGYIICNLEVEGDNPEKRSCNGCNICINSCPTGALMDNYEYNAKLCISYLTQTKDDIEYSLREKMGDSLYGCDICQIVCPCNADIAMGNEVFRPENRNDTPNLFELLELSNRQFKKRFGETAFSWRGNKIIKRNALIALGNSKNKKLVKYLVEYLNNPSAIIRKYTAWAIINLDKAKGKTILDEHLKEEKEIEVIEEIRKLYKYYL